MNTDAIMTRGASTTKNRLPPFTEVYRVLIATPSVSATKEAPNQSNAGLIILLTDWFRDLDFSVEVQPMPGTRNKFNMLASCGQGTGGLLLAGHADTMPFDGGRWTRNPFTLTEHDGELYSLGTTNVRDFLAFILDALRDTNAAKLAKPLYTLATVDEETSMVGTRYFVETTALRPDCAIIGEPTSLQPVHTHKGHISNAIRIQGQSGRSSDLVRGVSTIELMHDAIGHILQLRDNLKKCYHCGTFTVSCPALNLGHIHDGDASSRIRACCELYMDIRPLPGTTLNELSGLLNDALAPVDERWPGRLTVDELHPPVPGYECPPDHQLVGVAEKLLGAKTEVVNYCTETPFIQTLYPTLILEPGSISQAHQPNEYLETRFTKSIRELITQVIYHFYWY